MVEQFRGEYGFLSNFFPAKVQYLGMSYPTAEHAFQAAKCVNGGDRLRIRNAATPAEAKKLGRKVELISVWEDIKDEVMYNVVFAKFSQHPNLLHRLLATGTRTLIEGNHWHDNYWGDCLCEVCASIKGKNKLGCILMRVRMELNASMSDLSNERNSNGMSL